MEEEAERDGLRVSFDMFPYTAAATMMIAIYRPGLLEGGVDRLIERLKDQKTRRRIERDVERKTPSWPPWREHGLAAQSGRSHELGRDLDRLRRISPKQTLRKAQPGRSGPVDGQKAFRRDLGFDR